MKVLFVCPYMYVPGQKKYELNKTGFGMMVRDIAKSVGQRDVDVKVVVHAFGPGRVCEGFSILPNSLLRNIFWGHYSGLISYVAEVRKAGLTWWQVVREIYYYLHLGYIKQLMEIEKPDLIHIHGCSNYVFALLSICREKNVKFVVTLHGLLENGSDATKCIKLNEQRLIRNSHGLKIPITVISSQMKSKFLSNYYGARTNKNVTVITNGVDTKAEKVTENIRLKFAIDESVKIILAVGSVCERKNQKQILRAFNLLTEAEKNKVVIIIVGTVSPEYDIEKEAKILGVQDKVFVTGFVPHEELQNYYSVATMVVMASVSEGFGLSMAEGFVYGVPCVTFADLDAVPDLYDQGAMILAEKRSDEALANAMSCALIREWDHDYIRKYADKFSLDKMANKYVQLYEQLLEE